MAKSWKKEIARDIIALGSIPFYAIVFVRVIIGKYMPFIYYMVIAFVLLIILSKLIKNSNMHIARGLVLMVFISFFYKVLLFTVFAGLLWVLMLVSSYYLKVKTKEIWKGVLLGVLSMLISYLIMLFFMPQYSTL